MTSDMSANLDWSGLEVLSLDECYELLQTSPVGRLGFVDRGEPVILPVNFGLLGRSPVMRTAQGSKLGAAVMQQPVCLEVDDWDVIGHSGWSVLVKGLADHVVEPEDVARMDALSVRPWSRPDLRVDWVRIVPEEVTGRRIPGTRS